MKPSASDKLSVQPAKAARRYGRDTVRFWHDRVQRRTSLVGGKSFTNSEFSVRIALKRRREWFPLHTDNKETASRLAGEIYRHLLGHGWEITLQKYCGEAAQKRTGAPVTLGDFFALMLERSPLNAVTLHSYILKIRTVVSAMFGLKNANRYRHRAKSNAKPGREQWRLAVDRVKLADITVARLEEWRAKELAALRDQPAAQAARKNSITSMFRNARSLFCQKNTKFLPFDLEGQRPFHGFSIGCMNFQRYTSLIEMERLVAAAYRELKDQHPDSFWVLWLGLFAGLRRSEIDRLKWSDTRVIFCWFVKEKTLPDGRPLLPYDLFDSPRIRELLKDTSPEAGTYYTAVLQNLFFATLNTEMDPPSGTPGTRRFARKITADHMVHTLWRHEDQLTPAGRERLPALLRSVPFLNGGLFECLDDRVEIEGSTQTREIRVDGFSTNPAKQPRIPNFLFFGGERTADLSAATGNSARDHVTVTPLLDILNSFVWTITESTPLEEEVALDPDLLGNVFENLLAAYNPETGTVARNATGSFYTPDYVVDWMIEQALEPLLLAALPPKTKKASPRLRRLLDWDEPGHDFDAAESRLLIDAISRLRSLDPACGSGAYPMGLLKKMVRLLTKLDPDNSLWRERQLALAEQLTDTARDDALAAIDRAFSRNNDDYGRKLYLIENSIYGVDIQPLAVQIAKLRFFITLIVDQPINPALPNYGILPLPNLETKIVPANTLLGLQRGQLLLGSDEVRALERELKAVRHSYFTARRYQDKKALRRRDRDLCKKLATALVESGECTPSDAKRLVEWNPYNTNTYAGFFDPGWMFGLEGQNGAPGKFDLVIGNPPYVRQEELKAITVRDSAGRNRPLKDVLKEQYECYTGTADLYVYFFERSLQLLRTGGVLSFITSNKYFRAGYGEKLRAYLLYATAPRVLLDFGDTDIFTAIAYPCILVTEKVRDLETGQLPAPALFEKDADLARLVPHAEHSFPVLAWKPAPAGGESKVDFPVIFDRDSFALRQRDLKPTSWRLESATGLSLLDRIRKSGTPLGEYVKNRWYWGIKTGFNEAFCVDRETRARLIAEHKSSADVIKPLLRGRDVKRWRCDFSDQYLIKIESSENVTHPWSDKTGKEAEAVFAKKYPAIHRFFNTDDHRTKLIDRTDQGRFFWELRSCAYWEKFEQPKIIVPAISGTVNVAVDTEGYFANNKASIFVSAEARYLAAVVNSPVAYWFTTQVFATKQGGFWDFEPRYSSQWPIPAATPEQKSLCEALSGALIELHKPAAAKLPEHGLIVSWFEQWLNGLVYELFFPGELHARGLHLFAETAKLLPDAKLPPKSIPEVFTASRDFKRPLRAMLTDLTTIEEVRLIEEAGK